MYDKTLSRWNQVSSTIRYDWLGYYRVYDLKTQLDFFYKKKNSRCGEGFNVHRG